jgi:hypothetical protein
VAEDDPFNNTTTAPSGNWEPSYVERLIPQQALHPIQDKETTT